jgi:hypothetical protein
MYSTDDIATHIIHPNPPGESQPSSSATEVAPDTLPLT